MKKISGTELGLFTAVFCLAGAAVLTGRGLTGGGVLLCGLGLGYILQRSRFCMASAYTDLLVFKDGSLFRALLIFILVCSVGFFFVGLKTGREGFVVALGWRTVLGGLLFGCGMVLAGGCAAGTIMRLGKVIFCLFRFLSDDYRFSLGCLSLFLLEWSSAFEPGFLPG